MAEGESIMWALKRINGGWVVTLPDGRMEPVACFLDGLALIAGEANELWAGTFWAGEGGAEEVLDAAE
jgi:hypothetical protein